jgi:acetyltransferase-like isoleucine patch superfamily enzyme
MIYLMQQGGFVLRHRYFSKLPSIWRKLWVSFLGMHIGSGTALPKIFITWPHQVSIGNNCLIEHHTIFKFDGIWQKGPSICLLNNIFIGSGCEFNIRKGIVIGNNSNIASGCRFIDHDHGTESDQLIGGQAGDEQAIKLGNDVWLGCNVVVLKGVEIGDGAIVGAGAVVTKSISANEIWAGVPARKIGQRS